MENKKKAGKKIMLILLIFIASLLLLFGIWALMSPGKIRTYEGEMSLSEKFVTSINGAPNGFFINSKNVDNPVLLLVMLHLNSPSLSFLVFKIGEIV